MLIAAKLLKFGVALDKNVQCKVGSCLLTWFVFDQQNIHCTAVRRICGVLKLQRIILKSKCDVSEWEIPWYYWKLRKIFKTCADCADQKHVINLTFGLTVCFNGYQLQMFGNKTSHVWHPILEQVFCRVFHASMQPVVFWIVTYYTTFSKLKHCFTYVTLIQGWFLTSFSLCETSTWHLFFCSFLVHVM